MMGKSTSHFHSLSFGAMQGFGSWIWWHLHPFLSSEPWGLNPLPHKLCAGAPVYPTVASFVLILVLPLGTVTGPPFSSFNSGIHPSTLLLTKLPKSEFWWYSRAQTHAMALPILPLCPWPGTQDLTCLTCTLSHTPGNPQALETLAPCDPLILSSYFCAVVLPFSLGRVPLKATLHGPEERPLLFEASPYFPGSNDLSPSCIHHFIVIKANFVVNLDFKE